MAKNFTTTSNKALTEFDNDEFDKAYPDGIEHDFWNTARNKIVLSYLKAHNIDHILDIGCGRGIVTHHLSQNGFHVTGVELGIAAPISPEVPIFYNTDAITLPLQLREKIQAILLLDVIEHIQQPEDFLLDILNHFPNTVHVLVTVPAREELWSNYDDYYGHFRRYDLGMMKKTMEKRELNIIRQQYFFHSLYLPFKLLSLIRKKRQTKLSAPKSFLSKLLHSIIGWSFFVESKLFPKRLYGTSIICLAGKVKRSQTRYK